ncbi:MAG TPA: metal-dependent hydrolase [Polyangia bacterium]|nr:metal-dependent hydrolase [Polyangia bacterium]
MFALGHLGLGKKLATRPYRRFSRAEKRGFFVGTLLPDLIDKPLYYIPLWVTGNRGGFLSGTHLFGHTGLFLLLLIVAAWIGHSRLLRAIAIGVATHFVLDNVGVSPDPTLLWPLLGWRFPPTPFRSLGHQLSTILNPIILAGELLGGAVLWWDWRKSRRAAS